MRLSRKKGILLGKTRFQESSLIMRALLENGSIVSLMFKGALRSKTRVSAHLLPFALLEFVYYEKPGRAIHTASEVAVIEDFSANFADYESQAECSRFLKRAASILQPEQAIPEIFDIVLALLRAWAKLSGISQNLIRAGFLLKIMTFAGFAPAIAHCASCEGRLPANRRLHFSPSQGGFICDACSSAADATLCAQDLPATMEFMLGNSFAAFEKIKISQKNEKEIIELLEKFWAYHIGDRTE